MQMSTKNNILLNIYLNGNSDALNTLLCYTCALPFVCRCVYINATADWVTPLIHQPNERKRTLKAFAHRYMPFQGNVFNPETVHTIFRLNVSLTSFTLADSRSRVLSPLVICDCRHPIP